MQSLSESDIEARLADVGAVLSEQGHAVAIVVVGGAALLLRGEANRVATGDVDVLAAVDGQALVLPVPLPADLQEAVRVVAEGYGLSDDWMNAVVARNWAHRWPAGLPGDLLRDADWRTYGGLRVGLAGRSALIPLKVHAVVDQSRVSAFDSEGRVTRVDLSPSEARRHLGDLVALAPSDDELRRARVWVAEQDGSPQLSVFLDTIENHVRDARR